MKKSKKEKKALKKKKENHSKIKNSVFAIIFIVVLYLIYKVRSVQGIIIKSDGIDFLKTTLIFCVIIAPFLIFFNIRKMKSDYLINGTIAFVASIFLSFFATLLYDSYDGYINILSSKNTPIKREKCKIDFVSMSNTGMNVWYIFKGDTIKHIFDSRALYYKLNNSPEKYHLDIQYKNGSNNSYILNSVEIKQNN